MIILLIIGACYIWGVALQRLIKADWPAWTYYPSGLALSGLFLQWSWLAGREWSTVVKMWVLITGLLVVRYVILTPLITQTRWYQIVSKYTFRRQWRWPDAIPWYDGPWWWLWPVVLASGVLVVMWSSSTYPTAWDNITLYDWRAQRLADGWSWPQFATQLTRWPQYRLYDFYHPFITSVLSALVYTLGGHQVGALWLALGLSVMIGIWQTWPSMAARVSSSLLLFGSAIWVQTWTEAYATLPATWWWIAVIIFIWSTPRWRGSHHWLLVAIWLSAQISARSVEPYWLWLLLVGVMHQERKRKWALWPLLGPLITWLIWWTVRQWAHDLAGSDVIVPTSEVKWWLWLESISLMPIWQAFLVWIKQPLASIFILVLIGQQLLSIKQKIPSWWWLIFIGGEVILYLGILILIISPQGALQDLLHSLPRAALPLTALLILGLTDTTHHIYGQQMRTQQIHTVKKAKVM